MHLQMAQDVLKKKKEGKEQDQIINPSVSAKGQTNDSKWNIKETWICASTQSQVNHIILKNSSLKFCHPRYNINFKLDKSI